MKRPSALRGKKALRLDPWVLARKLAETLLHDDPSALNRVLGLLRSRSLSKIATLGQIRDSEYLESDINTHLALRQIASLFKKNEAFADDDVCTLAAKETFLRGERICRITNKRLDHFFLNPDRNDRELDRWLTAMQREIAVLLGNVDECIEDFPNAIRLTNGATEDRSRKRSLPFLKISGKLRAPSAAIPHVGHLLQEIGVDLASCKYECVERNVITLVPKNWKTHRTIAKEPTHSLPFQLALDSYLKRKLLRWGIDLSSQSRNQELAREGSLNGSLATIDLEMASDTLSFNTVAWMLPYDWFELMSSFRSSTYEAPWGSGEYAKYSSMGNGFTFSLETLIFTAAVRAVGSQRYSVYGDDIIIESDRVNSLTKLLTFLGFRINKEKSFVDPLTRFRESCGHDYYNGRFVTPFYLRDCPKETDYSGVSHVINGLIFASWPGPLWDYLWQLCKRLKLRLVPWNEDSRSGVFISPHTAWKQGKISLDHRSRPGKDNPTWGFPVFKGYGPVQAVRKTEGWRSYLLWFFTNQVNGVVASTLQPNHTGGLLIHLNGKLLDNFGAIDHSVSKVAVRTRYVHTVKRFVPVLSATPSILFLWEEGLIG